MGGNGPDVCYHQLSVKLKRKMDEATIKEAMALMGSRGGKSAASRMSQKARTARAKKAAAASAKVRTAKAKVRRAKAAT